MIPRGVTDSKTQAQSTQAILFDIDGTLIESGGASDRAWHRAFDELQGVDVQISKVTGKGVPDPAVGRQAFEAVIGREPRDEEMDALMAKRLEYLPEEVESSEGYRVMPNVEPLLEQLIDEGVLLGLVTGNVEPAAHIKLARVNLNRFFSFGGYGSDSDDRGELTKISLERASATAGEPLDPARCFSIGDTPRDVDAGHFAGIRVTGVATGKYSVEELTEAGADSAISSFEGGLPLLAA
jgi:phosphoglycolate phosphatase-like HAD superfamily hydrolase